MHMDVTNQTRSGSAVKWSKMFLNILAQRCALQTRTAIARPLDSLLYAPLPAKCRMHGEWLDLLKRPRDPQYLILSSVPTHDLQPHGHSIDQPGWKR